MGKEAESELREMEEAAVMPTWQRLLAALTQTSKIFPISSSVRVGFSPVVEMLPAEISRCEQARPGLA